MACNEDKCETIIPLQHCVNVHMFPRKQHALYVLFWLALVFFKVMSHAVRQRTSVITATSLSYWKI